MTFTRPANHRQLTFQEIAQSAKIQENEVCIFFFTTYHLNPNGITLFLDTDYIIMRDIHSSFSTVLFNPWLVLICLGICLDVPLIIPDCPSGGAVGDESSLRRTDQGKHRWSGPESSHDLGSAQSTRPATGTITLTTHHIYVIWFVSYMHFVLVPVYQVLFPPPQIKGMKDRLDLWCGDVKNMAMLVEQQAQDILT